MILMPDSAFLLYLTFIIFLRKSQFFTNLLDFQIDQEWPSDLDYTVL